MTFLLVKILSLMVLAAFFGGALAWWAIRRRHEDVTEEYTSLKTQWAQWREAIDERLSKPMAVDLGQLQSQLNSLESGIRSIQIPATDLTPVLRAIDSIPIPEQPSFDLTPVMSRLTQLEDRVRAIPLPEIPASPEIPLLLNALKAIEQQVKAIQVPQPKEVNLAPAMAHLARIEETVREFRPMPNIDLGPVQARLDETAKAVRAINIPTPQAPNLSPVLERLQAIELRLMQEADKQTAAKIRPGSRNLLLQPDFGKPDDLKRIKGVAEGLERMLHMIGVYYFWQVADWDEDDIAYVDGLLTAFKGRIDRDHWVSQCIDFALEGTAARKPQTDAVTA